MVASSVDVDVLAADDSAELLSALSSGGGAAAGDAAFAFATAAGGRPFGRTGGFVFPPTAAVAAAGVAFALDADTVLVVFLVLIESLSVSSSSSSSDEPSSSSESVELSGEKILFFLLESESVPLNLLLVAAPDEVGAGSFGAFVVDPALVVADGVAVVFGAVVVADLEGCGTLALMLPLPALEALALVRPSNCCCCCLKKRGLVDLFGS